jgi:nicotinamide mononucleotide transporter
MHEFSFSLAAEVLGVGFNLLFILLLIKRNIWCWLFGILGSAIGVYNFLWVGLYSEAILFSFYVLMGFYGWWAWARKSTGPSRDVSEFPFHIHLLCLLAGAAGALSMGWWFRYHSDAALPWHDAFSTSFSLVATWLEAKKILSGWLYWIVLNAFSIWLYSMRGLLLYAILAAVYTIMSVYGYYTWRKAIPK